MLGQLGPQRGLDHAARQLRQQPARAGDLLGLKALQRVLQRVRRQQPGQPVDRSIRRTLRCVGALRRISLGSRCLDGHRCPSRPQGPNRSPRPHTLIGQTPRRVPRDRLAPRRIPSTPGATSGIQRALPEEPTSSREGSRASTNARSLTPYPTARPSAMPTLSVASSPACAERACRSTSECPLTRAFGATYLTDSPP